MRFKEICVLLLFVSLVRAEEKIENGGYNVLVAFSQNVPTEIGMEIIGQLETSLQRASEILQNAIGLPFSKVTFEIPDSWDVSAYGLTIEKSFESDSVKADIVIDNTDDTVFGNFPFAQQYGSCGVPGDQIILPTAFYQELNKFPKGIALAREWLKYQYGVFDENGYSNDPLYPLYYHTPGKDPNEVHITDCTNSEVTYNFTDNEGNECPSNKMLIDKLNDHECVFKINEEDLENVHSSLMYFHESIKNMTDICGKDGDHPHNSRVRNKQNVLCNEESIWDVIKKSSHFSDEEVKKKHKDIEFVLSQKEKPRVVVSWEYTEALKSKGKIVINAITKLLIDLPYGSKFRAFPFYETVPDADYSLQDLNDLDTKKAIASTFKSDFAVEGNGNFKAAIQKAISILQAAAKNSDKPPGNIIVITGTPDDLIIMLLKDLNVCKTFDINLIPENREELSNLPCFEVARIPMSDEPEEFYKKLIETIERICQFKIEDKLTEPVKLQFIEQNKALTFNVDDFTEAVTFSIFTTEKESGHFNMEFDGEKITDGEIESYGNVLELHKYPITQAGSINFTYPYKTDPILVEAKKTSKAGKYFSVKVMVHDTTAEDDTNQMPVIIYAIVRFGSYPVQKATVIASIRNPNGNLTSLIMNDDGKGDPDITQNDGVYSRYFINFDGTGEYHIKMIVAIPAESEARYGADDTTGYGSCCGSFVNEGTSALSKFSKIVETTFTTEHEPPEDGYKPSRITDLRIGKTTDDGIVLEWTAPGGEADYGRASSYAIKLLCGTENTTQCNIHEVIQVLIQPPPLNYGKEQQLKIKIVDKTQILSIGIIAINEKNKMSSISNIIEIYRPSETSEIITEAPVVKTGQVSKIGTIIGWVIAGILIIICILGVVIYFRRKQKHKQPELRNTEVNKDDHKIKPTFATADIPSMKTATVKRIESFPVLLYTHDQIKDRKNKKNDQSLNKSNVPPKQWKSLDVISMLEKKKDKDTKSLSSSSTVNLEDDNKK